MNQVDILNDEFDNKEVIESVATSMEGTESAPTLDTPEESKPLTPEQIAYHQKQLRIKALKVAKLHKDAVHRIAQNKVQKEARKKNRKP